MNNKYQDAINIIKDTFKCTDEDAKRAIQESEIMTYVPNGKKVSKSLKEIFNKLK